MPLSKIPSLAIKKLGLLTVGALLVLVLAGALNFFSTQNLINVNRWVEHTDEVLRDIAAMRLSLQRAEDAVAFYVLTGESSRFQPLNEAIVATNQRIDELQNLTADNAAQQSRLAQLKTALHDEFTALQKIIALDESRGTQPAQAALKDLQSDRNRATISSLIDQITGDEQILLQRRSLAAESSAQRTAATIVAAMVAGVLIVFWLLRLLVKQIITLEQTEEVLRQSAAELTDLYEEAPFGYHIMDSDGVFLRVNNTELNWFGLKREEVAGRKRFTDVLAPESLKPFAEYLSQLKKNGSADSPAEIELKVVKSDQQILPVLMSSLVLHDKEGNFRACRSTVIDISQLASALEALRLSEEFFRLTVHNVQEYAIFALDTNGVVVSWNEGAQRIKGYASDEIIGHHFSCFYLKEDVEAGKPKHLLQEAIRKGRVEDEGWHVRKDGSRFWANVVITALRDEQGTLIGFGKVVRDMTERKRLEDGLRTARDQAIDASRFKSEFLANMSHEIRTPMNGIIGMTNILQRTDLSAQQREYLNIVRDASTSLMSIINDILDFSKVEAGKVNLESLEFDPVSVVESVGDLLASQARLQNVSLMTFVSPEIPCLLIGDPGRLRQILMNLTSNAIKFSPHGSVVVKALLSRLTEYEVVVRFEVSDTGIGISDQQQSRLFKPFIQADGSTERKYGGTGLGLAISKSLVELMGGNIGLESTLGRGSTFWFTVPLRLADRSHAKPAPGLKPDLSGLRVLVVDDEPLARDVIHNYVTSWGMRNGMASSAADALSLLRRAYVENDPYHLMLVDLVMEGRDGIDLAQDVLKDARLRDTKMILITALDATGLAEQSIEHGFSGYLRKPVRQSQLMDCIATVMRRTGEPVPANRPATWKPEIYQNSKYETPLLDTTKTVLVVEDNNVNQQVALLQLKQLGLTADAVSDGKEALEALDRIPYSLVLMDCQMPELDGFTTTRLIRQMEARTSRKHTPIIAMTAQAMEGDRDKCLAAGMDDYISKPIDERRLATVLARWIPGNGPAGDETIFLGASETKDGLLAINRSLIDYDFLSREFGASEAVALLSLFKTSSARFKSNLSAALESPEATDVRPLLHELKGSAAALKADRVSSLTAQLEEILKDSDDERFKKLLPELLDALEKTIKTIDNIIESHQGSQRSQ